MTEAPDRPHRWEEREDAILRVDYVNGSSVGSIAAATGRTKKAIMHRASVLRLRRPRSIFGREQKMKKVAPWADPATVVQFDFGSKDKDTPPTSVFEGTLRDAVRFLRNQGSYASERYRVSLPDRHCAPFEYQGPAIEALLAVSR